MKNFSFKREIQQFSTIKDWIREKDLSLSHAAIAGLEHFARHCASSCDPEIYDISVKIGCIGDIIEHYDLDARRTIMYRRTYLEYIKKFLSQIEGFSTSSALELLGKILAKKTMTNGALENSLERFVQENTHHVHWELHLGEIYLLLEKFSPLKTSHVPRKFERSPREIQLEDYLPNWILEFLFKLTRKSAARLITITEENSNEYPLLRSQKSTQKRM